MNQYQAKRINLSTVKDRDDYWRAIKTASVHYCNGLKELRDYCGGKLHRQRCGGYAGINGNIEYVAIRVK